MKKRVTTVALLMLSGPVLAADGAYSFGVTNTLDLLSNVRGGIRTGSRALEKFDVTAGVNGDSAGMSGWDGFFHLQWTHDNDFTGALVGDAQTVSNIDAPEGFRVMDAWISRALNDHASVKFGIIDLNAEFDVQNPGLFLLNSSNGIAPDFSQSGLNGPSIFPSTGLGFVGAWQPMAQWEIKAGIFEGIPGNPTHPGRTDITLSGDEGALLTAETRYHMSPRFTVGLGAWHYTAGFSAIGAPGIVHGNTGVYGLVETTLMGDPDEGPHLDGWLRTGFANARINPIRAYVGGGLVYTGPFGREGDQVGLSGSHVVFGAPARLASGLTASETAIEASYSFVWKEWAIIQPDIQYVASPGGDPALKDAVVAGARIILSWQ